MLETELKCMLDEETYLKLKHQFKWDWIKEQENHYYSDISNTLRKKGITFRIRTKDGINKLQIKMHKSTDKALQICDEYEYPISDIPDIFTASQVKELIGYENDVIRLGSLKTLRHSCIYSDGVEICLDKNDYLGKTDYEIEVEYTQTIPQELTDILKANSVTFTLPCSGKCSRFMTQLKNQSKSL